MIHPHWLATLVLLLFVQPADGVAGFERTGMSLRRFTKKIYVEYIPLDKSTAGDPGMELFSPEYPMTSKKQVGSVFQLPNLTSF